MMAGLGLSYVRIGEFAWSRLEPRPGELDFEWLDEAVNILGNAGLKVIMGTPTAAPPKWLVDQWPEVLPVDPDTGRTRGFGSRRHYDFSSEVYQAEALRITGAMVNRYGAHETVVGWQTDNELGCHNTALSGSDTARQAFRDWCRERYQSIDALNRAWGNVFWSMEYADFSAIELPIGAVTHTNPAHCLAYRRFSSARVIHFHNRMVELIRRHAPGKFVTHNFIPMDHTGVDNFALAAPLDFASYDNYPLGQTDQQFAATPAEEFRQVMRTGHPDFATWYLDQTRGLSNGNFWVMEQQPGPVNWADNNPRPAKGMVRLWSFEAFAQGADCVCYFRWRQVPFAQEQMHAGLLRPDSSKTSAWQEIEQTINEAATLNLQHHRVARASVAMVTGAESLWVSEIERQSNSWDPVQLEFDYYSALRQLGVSVDFVSAGADFMPYALVVVPCLPIVSDTFVKHCEQSDATFIFGPRSGAKTAEFGYPPDLPPGPLQRLAPLRVLSVETLRADCPEGLIWEGKRYASRVWREELEAQDAVVLASYDDGSPAVVQYGCFIYLATLTDSDFLRGFLAQQCLDAGIKTYDLGPSLRLQQRGKLMFAFNYSEQEQELPVDKGTTFLLGARMIQPRDVAVWEC